MNEDKLVELENRIAAIEKAPVLPITLDPQSKAVFDQNAAIPFSSTDPTTGSPNYNGYARTWKDGSTYKLSIYADGGWRTFSATTGIDAGTWSFSVPSSTLVDTPTTNDFGFVPKMVFGAMTGGGVGTIDFFGVWQNGQEQNTSLVTDGHGSSSIPFLGADASFYANNLSVSGTVLTIHYKNTGASSATVYLWAIG